MCPSGQKHRVSRSLSLVACPGPLTHLYRVSRLKRSRISSLLFRSFFLSAARPRVLTFTSRNRRSRYDKTVDAGVLDQNLPYPNRLMPSCRQRLIKDIKFLIFGLRDTSALYATPTDYSPIPSSPSPGLDFVSFRLFITLNIAYLRGSQAFTKRTFRSFA